jgi:short-subunit dehydrogenase
MYTLITGASGGIGYALAREFAANGHNLVLVARNEDKLLNISNELHEKFGIEAIVIAVDLAKDNAAQTLFDECVKRSLSVDIVVNNAGFGDYMFFHDSDLQKQINMVDLNIKTLMKMTYLFGNEMKKRGYGRILNIASMAALFAIPYFSVYCATKAFVLNFSLAVNSELQGTGVTVTTLCPGPVNTGFEDAANVKYTKTFKIGAYSPEKIAKVGYRAVIKGKSVKYGGFVVSLLNFFSRILPRTVVTDISKKSMAGMDV